MPHRPRVESLGDARRRGARPGLHEAGAEARARRARCAVRGHAREAARAASGDAPRFAPLPGVAMENQRIVLASRPEGWVTPQNFRLEKTALPQPGEGEVLVKNLWLSLDPYMRGRMSEQKSYVKGVDLGEVMVGQTAAEVVESRHPGFKPGDKVLTQTGWQLYAATKEAMKVDASRAPLSYYRGLLGMPGMTAYFGLKEIGQPKAGETVVVSAASGAVGSVVGQLAKLWGCRAIGIAGGRENCDYVKNELGFDACIDYKAGKLRDDFPKGIDVY